MVLFGKTMDGLRKANSMDAKMLLRMYDQGMITDTQLECDLVSLATRMSPEKIATDLTPNRIQSLGKRTDQVCHLLNQGRRFIVVQSGLNYDQLQAEAKTYREGAKIWQEYFRKEDKCEQ